MMQNSVCLLPLGQLPALFLLSASAFASSFGCCPRSVQSSVCDTVECPPVCVSVPLIDCSSGMLRFAAEHPVGRRCRSMAGSGTQFYMWERHADCRYR